MGVMIAQTPKRRQRHRSGLHQQQATTSSSSSTSSSSKSSQRYNTKWLLCLLGLCFWTGLQHVRILFFHLPAATVLSPQRRTMTTSKRTTESIPTTAEEEESRTTTMIEAWSAAGLPWNQLLAATSSSLSSSSSQQQESALQNTTTLESTSIRSNRTTHRPNAYSPLTIDPAIPQNSKYAYAFLVGGALSDKGGSDYRGGLFSTIVAAHALRRQGSTADMILMVQLSARSSETTLPIEEETLLQKSNIRVVYLPKFAHEIFEVFYSLQLEKFRILQLDEYERITYLDNDILPHCSLDYLMELSNGDKKHNGKRLLQDNVVMAYKTEPSSGGLFVVKPSRVDYERLQGIILEKEQRGLAREYPHWDEVEGWGAVIPEDQPWITTLGEKGTNWTWHGANCDQGLLYYWTKYIQQNVSIIIKRMVQQWGSDFDPESSQLTPRLIDTDTSNVLFQYGCKHPPPRVRFSKDIAPYNSFIHLAGRSKPWYANLTRYQLAMDEKKDDVDSMDNKELWFWLLQDALRSIGMEHAVSLNFISEETKQPAVGRAPSFPQMALYLWYKKKNGWKQYEYEEGDDVAAKSLPEFAADLPTSDDSSHQLVSPQQPFASNSKGDWYSQQKYAYAFLLGGARSDRPGSDYRGGLYSVVVAAHLFRKHGSHADVVLMVQISAETNHTKLPELEEKVLKAAGVKIVYLPKFAHPNYECFYSLMMEKFRIASLVEYRRVMYLDYDIMPRCNMDYLFHLSDPSPAQLKDDPNRFRLKENVGVAFKSDPANGGIFIMTPNADDFQHIQRIIHKKEVDALELPYPHWNETIGWGHEIQSPDYWRSTWGRNGTTWSWYGSNADQGLIYYWMKYVKKSVSLIIRHEVEQWEANNETGVLERDDDFHANVLDECGCGKDLGSRKSLGSSPHSDFVHLTGRSKPWNFNRDELEQAIKTKKFKDCNDREKWYFSLVEALKGIGMYEEVTLDFILGTPETPAVGIAPSFQQMAKYFIAKRRNGWRQYERVSDEPDVIQNL